VPLDTAAEAQFERLRGVDHQVDAERSRVTVRAAELKRPFDFHAPEPIYLAAMVDLATRLDDRPKSFT
jgi:hypothetical protein